MFRKVLIALLCISMTLGVAATQVFGLLTAPSDVELIGGFTKVWLSWTVNHTNAESDSCGIFYINGTDTTLYAYVSVDTLTWGYVDTLYSNNNYPLTVGVLDTSGVWVYAPLVDSLTAGIPEQIQDDVVSGIHWMKLPTAESYTKEFSSDASTAANQLRYLYDMDSDSDSDSSVYFHPWDYTAFYVELYNAVADSTKFSVYIKGCYGDPASATTPFVTVPIDTISVTSDSQQDNPVHMVDTSGTFTLYQWLMCEVVGDSDCGVNQQFYIWIGRSRSVIPGRR